MGAITRWFNSFFGIGPAPAPSAAATAAAMAAGATPPVAAHHPHAVGRRWVAGILATLVLLFGAGWVGRRTVVPTPTPTPRVITITVTPAPTAPTPIPAPVATASAAPASVAPVPAGAAPAAPAAALPATAPAALPATASAVVPAPAVASTPAPVPLYIGGFHMDKGPGASLVGNLILTGIQRFGPFVPGAPWLHGQMWANPLAGTVLATVRDGHRYSSTVEVPFTGSWRAIGPVIAGQLLDDLEEEERKYLASLQGAMQPGINIGIPTPTPATGKPKSHK